MDERGIISVPIEYLQPRVRPPVKEKHKATEDNEVNSVSVVSNSITGEFDTSSDPNVTKSTRRAPNIPKPPKRVRLICESCSNVRTDNPACLRCKKCCSRSDCPQHKKRQLNMNKKLKLAEEDS